MVDVASSVEVDKRLKGNLGLNVLLFPRFGHLFAEVVEGCHVGLVVFVVVQFHDLPGDGGLEGAVVIFINRLAIKDSTIAGCRLHGRSGSVAFPRTKVVPANPARDAALGAEARSAERRAVVRRSVEFMVAIDGFQSIGAGCEVIRMGGGVVRGSRPEC